MNFLFGRKINEYKEDPPFLAENEKYISR